MGLYNVLEVDGIRCPCCDRVCSCRIEFRFGVIDLLEYHLGDELLWIGNRKSFPREKPKLNEWAGEGYATCNECESDFYVTILIVDNHISHVYVDLSREVK